MRHAPDTPTESHDEAAPQLSLAADATGNGDLKPAPSPGPVSGGIDSAMRTHAVPPTAIAPIRAKAFCHISADAPICARPRADGYAFHHLHGAGIGIANPCRVWNPVLLKALFDASWLMRHRNRTSTVDRTAGGIVTLFTDRQLHLVKKVLAMPTLAVEVRSVPVVVGSSRHEGTAR